MKKIEEIKTEFTKLEQLKELFHYTTIKPSKMIQDAYQEIYDYLYNLLDIELQIKMRELDERKNEGPNVNKYKIQNIESAISTIKEQMANLSNSLVIAGGCLSEQFIEGYELNYKDIDIFLSNEFSYQYRRMVELKQDGSYGREVDYYNFESLLHKSELEFILGNIGYKKVQYKSERKEKVYPDKYSPRSYMEDRNILGVMSKVVSDVKIELIIVEELRLNFDLAFREYFYNGDTIFYSDAAKKDKENKKITIKNFATPFSTLVRIEEFSKRYNLRIDELVRELLIKFCKFKSGGDEEKNRNILKMVEKYKTKELEDRILDEIKNAEITNFEQQILEFIYQREDKIYPYIERIKMVLKDEKNNVSYCLEETYEIEPYSFDNIYSFTGDISKIKEVDSIINKQKKIKKMKEIFKDREMFQSEYEKMFLKN